MKKVPSQALQQAVERMDISYQNFFKGGGFPKYAKKDFYTSFQVKQGVKITKNKIYVPNIGWVRYFNSQEIKGLQKIKLITIKKQSDGYFISLCVAQINPFSYIKPMSDSQAVGIDLGVSNLAVLSNGIMYSNPKALKKHADLMRVEQRSLARKVKGSSNRNKCKKRISKLHLKIKNIREDNLKKATTEIVKNYGGFVLEDLKLKNMSKSSKGNAEKHGKNVAQKSGLNKSILDSAMGKFAVYLEYKSDWYARTFEKVDAKYTSQDCFVCGHRSKENRKTQEKFKCVSCGHQDNADVNAAKNILARAKARSRKAQAVV
ncbi:transposase [Tenacibaculum finnmarkense genomovar ulcerans]|nr:transposase [Tenacibaculum finnmarkense genomovar ulcerans]